MGILLSIGKWGGVYAMRGEMYFRLCAGWVALTVVYFDGDKILTALASKAETAARVREE